ncbi:peptidoglycan editing factor PgeF [Patescibacteria group bacterium]
MIYFKKNRLNIWSSEKTDGSVKLNKDPKVSSQIPQKILKQIPTPKDKIIEANQVHGSHVEVIHESQVSPHIKKIKSTDGIITNSTNIALMIKTADCIPVVLYDQKKQIVATIHAGWRGLRAGIQEKAIKLMTTTFKSQSKDIYAYIAPSILKCCYKFKDKPEQFGDEKWKIHIINRNKFWHIDLKGFLVDSLIGSGVQRKNIHESGKCTYHDDGYYSHLKHKTLGETSGSMATIVKLDQ